MPNTPNEKPSSEYSWDNADLEFNLFDALSNNMPSFLSQISAPYNQDQEDDWSLSEDESTEDESTEDESTEDESYASECEIDYDGLAYEIDSYYCDSDGLEYYDYEYDDDYDNTLRMHAEVREQIETEVRPLVNLAEVVAQIKEEAPGRNYDAVVKQIKMEVPRRDYGAEVKQIGQQGMIEATRAEKFIERAGKLGVQRNALASEYNELQQQTSQLGNNYQTQNSQLHNWATMFYRSPEASKVRLDAVARIQQVAKNVAFDLDDSSGNTNMKMEYQALKLQQAISTIKGAALKEYRAISDTYIFRSAENSALCTTLNKIYGCSSIIKSRCTEAESVFQQYQAQQAKVGTKTIEDRNGIECSEAEGGLAFSV